MLPNLTFVHIATTGPDETAADIFEYAACRVHDGEVTDTFEQLARVDQPLPLHVQKRTGLTHADLADCPSTEKVLEDFLDFIKLQTVVCWDSDEFSAFMDEKSQGRFRQQPLDLWQVACIVMPTATSFNMEKLAEHLGLAPADGTRAAARLDLTVRLWSSLCEAGGAMSLPVASEVSRILRTTAHPLVGFFDALERRVIRGSLGARKMAMEDCIRDFSDIIKNRPKQRRSGHAKLDEDALIGLFEPDGVLAQTHEAYERRQEQIDMVAAVCRAFNTGSHLMVEAGTGTGKSLAYLVPAIYWASENDAPVIISTNTKNLQEQLFFKDVPYLQAHLDQPFACALIKGRGNYLCTRKLLYLLREAERELSPDERLALLPVIVWFDLTETGDLAECAGFAAGPTFSLRSRLTTRAEECMGRGCRHYYSCFVRRARAIALAADIVVANHAVVFAELGQESPVLPPHEHIVFDEAHNIEDVATEFLARRASRLAFHRILGSLYRPGREAGTGLLPALLAQVRMAEDLPEDTARAMDAACVRAFTGAGAAADEAERFFTLFSALFQDQSRDERLRFRAGYRPKDLWEPIAQGKRSLFAAVAEFAKLLGQIRGLVLDVGAKCLDSAEEFVTELKASVDALREVCTDLEFILRAKEHGHVYWVERRTWGDEDYEVCAAPLEIAKLMVDQVYSQKQTVIMSSATLTVGGSFDFVRSRLGADTLSGEDLQTAAVGSPFDFDAQTLVAVPSFLPEPGAPGAAFEDGLVELMAPLFRATQGRGLVLFTSYAMLNHTYDALKRELSRDGILVLGQGHDGGRSHLAAVFREVTSSVLLGTQSFWEGVDFVGESLSCLVVVKLPFAVFTDPLVEARCEHMQAQGRDAFMGYTVPSAAIKFRQGFGRLIRTRTDRGVVLITDRRVLTRRYGQQFLGSLPTQARSYDAAADMISDVQRFLAAE